MIEIKKNCSNCKFLFIDTPRCNDCERLEDYTGNECCPTCGRIKYTAQTVFTKWEESL